MKLSKEKFKAMSNEYKWCLINGIIAGAIDLSCLEPEPMDDFTYEGVAFLLPLEEDTGDTVCELSARAYYAGLFVDDDDNKAES